MTKHPIRSFGLAAVALVAAASLASAAPETLRIDPNHSNVGFSIRHLFARVNGRFTGYEGTVAFDAAAPAASSVDVTIQAASITTQNDTRDKDLRSDNFFDVAKYPTLTFKSTRVERKGKDAFVLHGDLTIKGVTKPVQLPFQIAGAVKDPWGNTRFGIEAQTKINRRDFGINYGNAFAGGLDVGNEVTISLRLEAVQPGTKPAGE